MKLDGMNPAPPVTSTRFAIGRRLRVSVATSAGNWA
jgi:hypothetical protein